MTSGTTSNSTGQSFATTAIQDLAAILIVGDRRLCQTTSWLEGVSRLHIQTIDHVGGWNAEGMPNPWKEMVQACQSQGAKAFSYLSIEVERDAFTRFYSALADSERWRYPNGLVITDPIEGGAAKNLLGEPCGHWHIYQGKPIPGANMVSMSLQNPHFLTWQFESARMHLDAGADGVTWLNPEMEPFSVTGDFSDWSKQAFREHLRQRLDVITLSALGIQDLSTFDVATYLLKRYAKTSADIKRGDPGGSQIWISTKAPVFDDVLVREWVKFQRITLVNFFEDLTERIRRYAQGNKRAVALSIPFNVGSGPGMLAEVGTLLTSKCSDVIGLPICTKDYAVAEYVPEWSPKFRLGPAYRIANSAGKCEKPVWAYSQWKLDLQGSVSHTALNLRKLTIAEAYAHGGVREIMFADWLTDYQGASPPPELQDYLGFIWMNQQYFRSVSSPAKVAIVYSIPSFLWRLCPLFDMYGRSQRASIHGFARALEDSHLPYDIIIFGHPELRDDQLVCRSLSQYDLLVLPNVDCMSDGQIESVKEFVKQGGAVIASGEMGTRNEDYIKRGDSILVDLKALASSRVVHFPDHPELAYWENVIVKGVDDSTNLGRILSAVRSVLGKPQLESDGRRLVSIGLFEQSTPTSRLILHVLNYNYDFRDDSITAQENMAIRLLLPHGFQVGRVEYLSPDDSTMTAPSGLRFKTLEGGIVEFGIPRLFIWSIVVISPI
jgi:hypothetical protein